MYSGFLNCYDMRGIILWLLCLMSVRFSSKELMTSFFSGVYSRFQNVPSGITFVRFIGWCASVGSTVQGCLLSHYVIPAIDQERIGVLNSSGSISCIVLSRCHLPGSYILHFLLIVLGNLHIRGVLAWRSGNLWELRARSVGMNYEVFATSTSSPSKPELYFLLFNSCI